ncbi:MAG: tocopherol cyclase family protein, partial [Treponemataceae bacterium]
MDRPIQALTPGIKRPTLKSMVWRYFRILKPILFQGPGKKTPYFEGWYFKQVSGGNANARTFSAIPGISRSAEGAGAFIQTIGGTGQASRFFSFPYTDFSYSDTPFEIRIGANRFSLSGMDLDLADKIGAIRANLRYSGNVPPRTSLFRPGVMGPYGFTPFLECYHGIASMHHEVTGSVTFDKETQSFDGGRGYIEKDWGKSMPSSWIWIQTTEFAPAIGPASFSFSLARVPWLGSSFAGFICL